MSWTKTLDFSLFTQYATVAAWILLILPFSCPSVPTREQKQWDKRRYRKCLQMKCQPRCLSIKICPPNRIIRDPTVYCMCVRWSLMVGSTEGELLVLFSMTDTDYCCLWQLMLGLGRFPHDLSLNITTSVITVGQTDVCVWLLPVCEYWHWVVTNTTFTAKILQPIYNTLHRLTYWF